MTWNDLTFTSSHILTASDMNRLQGNFTGLAQGQSGAPALAVNSFMVSGVASIATLHVSSGASIAGGGLPTGAIIAFGGSSAPSGWLLCDGTAVSRATYATLFSVIGTVFGAGDGSTTFNLPDLRGRVVVARDNLGGSSANRITATWADSLGGTGGAETHTLTVAEMPSHRHSFVIDGTPIAQTGRVGGNFNNPYDTPVFGSATGGTQSISFEGGGGAHNNIQPTMALGAIIKT